MTFRSKQKTSRGDGWMNLLTGFGVNGRDSSVTTTYVAALRLMEEQLRRLYSGDGMVSNLVDMPAEDMTRKGFRVVGDEDGAVNAYYEEHGFNPARLEALRWNRLYGGSAILLGVNDGTTQLWQPVRERSIRSVEVVDVFDRFSVIINPTDFYSDPRSPKFGTPEKYTIQTLTGKAFKVHETRMCIFPGLPVPKRTRAENQGWGDSVVQRTYEQVKTLAESFGYSKGIINNYVQEVYSIKGLMDMLSTDEGVDTIRRRMQIMGISRSLYHANFLDSEESYTKHSTTLSGLPDLLDRIMFWYSAVSRIPQTKLFGRAPAGQNATGESDTRNYYDLVAGLQKAELAPVDERLVRYVMLSQDGPFKGKEPEGWKIEYLPLHELTEEQEAKIRELHAKAVKTLVDARVLHPKAAARAMFGGDRYGIDFTMNETEIGLLDWPEKTSANGEEGEPKPEGEE